MFNTKEEYIVTILLGTILFLSLVTVIIFSVINYHNKQKLFIKERDELRLLFQAELFQTKLEIQEQTFKDISQEIHDNIGQVLSLAKLNVNTMNKNDIIALDVKIIDTRKLLSKAISDLRDLSKMLNTDYIKEMGLANALKYQLDILMRTGSVQTEFLISGRSYKIKHQIELILFRIFQELTNNIIKHAGASFIRVQLSYNKENFILEVVDNGKGFNKETSDHLTVNAGLGLHNIKNRSKVIGADFIIETGSVYGTKAKITLPITLETANDPEMGILH